MLDGMSDYTTIKDRKSPLKGSRPSVPHRTNFVLLVFVGLVCVLSFGSVSVQYLPSDGLERLL